MRLLLYLYTLFLISRKTHTLLLKYNFLPRSSWQFFFHRFLCILLSLAALYRGRRKEEKRKRLFRLFSHMVDKKFTYFCWLSLLWSEAKLSARVLPESWTNTFMTIKLWITNPWMKEWCYTGTHHRFIWQIHSSSPPPPTSASFNWKINTRFS